MYVLNLYFVLLFPNNLNSLPKINSSLHFAINILVIYKVQTTDTARVSADPLLSLAVPTHCHILCVFINKYLLL